MNNAEYQIYHSLIRGHARRDRETPAAMIALIWAGRDLCLRMVQHTRSAPAALMVARRDSG